MMNFLYGLKRFHRGPWEMVATILIALGVFMLMQPYVLVAFTYSFLVTPVYGDVHRRQSFPGVTNG